MKAVRYLPRAQRALLRHRAEAKRIMAKISAYATDPSSQANNVKRLAGGSNVMRLRVGDFRVLFTETVAELTVIDVGPRGSIYE